MSRCLAPTSHRAFSLVEVVVSVMIVGMLFVASLSAVSAAQASRHALADHVRGERLAHDLISEVLRFGYGDPGGAGTIGPEMDEITGDRSQFDDVDDYHGWTSTPPQTRDGSDLDDFAGWSRQVAVAYVDPANPGSGAAMAAHRAKLITVTVTRGGRVVAELRAIRTAAMTDADRRGVLP